MIPAGFMLKRIIAAPEWLNAANVEQVFSVSGCVSENFADYIPLWRHNGWWLFDNAVIPTQIATNLHLDLSLLTPLYFEVFENEFDDVISAWRPIEIYSGVVTAVKPPENKVLHGYDVVSFWAKSSPECSPLSCNSLAREIITNRLCLFDEFDAAYEAVTTGCFVNSEPGPYRIFAVYGVPE